MDVGSTLDDMGGVVLIKLTVSGVEYLEPRNVEGRRGTVEEPYTVDRRITLDTDAVERRQVAIPRARAHT